MYNQDRFLTCVSSKEKHLEAILPKCPQWVFSYVRFWESQTHRLGLWQLKDHTALALFGFGVGTCVRCCCWVRAFEAPSFYPGVDVHFSFQLAAGYNIPSCSWDPAPYVHLARDMCLPSLCREGDLDRCSAPYREELNDAVSSNQGSQVGRCMRGSRHRSRWICVANCELLVWVWATASGWVAENREVKLFPSSCSCGHMYLLVVAMQQFPLPNASLLT